MRQVHYHLFVVVVVANGWLSFWDTKILLIKFCKIWRFPTRFSPLFQISLLEHLPTQPFLVSKRRRQLVLKSVFLIFVSKDKTSTTTIYLASQPLWNNVHPHPVSDQPNWYLFVILCIQSDVTHSTASSISTILKIISFW